MKKTILKTMAALPAVILMPAIFIFSAAEAPESTKSSMTVSFRLIRAAESMGFLHLSPVQEYLSAEAIEGPIRKLAHITEYTVLAAAVYLMFVLWTNRRILLYFVTVLFSLIYAASDEFHQLFVKGRSGSFSDVCVDAIGVTIGAMIMLAIDNIFWPDRSEKDEFNWFWKETTNADRKK